ncbi:hypothetical protein ACUL41_00215 [Virgibacillus natechei]
MKDKVPSIGYALIFLGIALILANVDNMFHIFYFHYILIFAGLIILIIYYLSNRKEKSLLCRIGLHKFEHIGWDDEVKFALIYRCQRCGYKKRVVRSTGG